MQDIPAYDFNNKINLCFSLRMSRRMSLRIFRIEYFPINTLHRSLRAGDNKVEHDIFLIMIERIKIIPTYFG